MVFGLGSRVSVLRIGFRLLGLQSVPQGGGGTGEGNCGGEFGFGFGSQA